MKTIATYSKLDDAYLARSRLEGSGVVAFIPNEYTASNAWARTQAMGGIRLQVQDEDCDRANEVLGIRPHARGDLVCPHCGSHNVRLRELSAAAALGILFFGFILPAKSRKADCLDCRLPFDFKGV